MLVSNAEGALAGYRVPALFVQNCTQTAQNSNGGVLFVMIMVVYLIGEEHVGIQKEKKEVDDKSAVKDEYENIQGTIEWDDTFDGELPEIVTKGKVYNWIELGKELMTYEGFRISIIIS